jgi:hypothetical protein
MPGFDAASEAMMNTAKELCMENLKDLENQVREQLANRLFDFRLSWNEDGLILMGSTRSYHVKQLAQEALRERTALPIALNEIQVC